MECSKNKTKGGTEGLNDFGMHSKLFVYLENLKKFFFFPTRGLPVNSTVRLLVWLLQENFLQRKWSPQDQGRFPFNKNPGSKFRKFHEPNGTVHSGCTDPTQTTARLVIRDFKNRGRAGSETRSEVTFPISDEERMRVAFFSALENAPWRDLASSGKREYLDLLL